MKRFFLGIIWLLVLIMTFGVSCAKNSASTSTATSSPAKTTSSSLSAGTSSATVKPTTSATVTPKYGGTLSTWGRVDPATFDIQMRVSHTTYLYAPIYNNLVRFDPNKKELIPQNIIPDLADKWEISPDGKVYTFYLHKGVTWHDGQPFTADDVKYTMEKLVDPKRSAGVENYEAFQKAEVVDPNTVKLYLSHPSAAFLSQLATVYAAMMAQHLSTVDPKTTAFLIGTGPYKFKAYQRGVSFELVKNPNYFKKGLPYLDGITYYIIPDVAAEDAAFLSKRLDMTNPTAGISDYQELKSILAKAPEVVYTVDSFPYTTEFFANVNTGPTKDVRVRKALAMMIDQKQIIMAKFGDPTWGRDEGLFVPPWANPVATAQKTLGWDKSMDARAVEAKKLLADAGYPNGFQLRFSARSGVAITQNTMQAAADIWRRYLNVDVQMVLEELSVASNRLKTHDFQLHAEPVYTILGDPDEYRAYYYTGGSMNYSGYSNPQVDKLFDQQANATTLADRIAATQAIEMQLLNDLPILPSGAVVTYGVAWYPYVKGFVRHPSIYSTNLQMEQVWLDK